MKAIMKTVSNERFPEIRCCSACRGDKEIVSERQKSLHQKKGEINPFKL
jgi:hypothetical protein